MSVVPACGRLKQEFKLLQGQDQSGLGSGEFTTSLCFRVILYLKNTKSQTTQKWAQVVFVGHTLTLHIASLKLGIMGQDHQGLNKETRIQKKERKKKDKN